MLNFVLLSIVISFTEKQAENKKLIKKTCDSLIFENFVYIIIILISLTYNLFPKASLNFLPKYCVEWLTYFIDFFIYYLLYCLLLNLFIVLKRMHVLIHDK